MSKTNRNELCVCGSNKKFKKCCALKVGLQKYKTTKLQMGSVSNAIVSKIPSFSKVSTTNLINKVDKPIQ